MEVTPSHAASLDVAFDELAPGECGSVERPFPRRRVNDEADASVHAASVIVFI